MPPPLCSVSARLTLLALFSATTFYCLYKSRRLRFLKLPQLYPKNNNNPPNLRRKILFVSQTGTSESLAHRLHRFLTANGFAFDVADIKDYEPEDLPKENTVLIVASTWEDGKPPASAQFFATWLAVTPTQDYLIERTLNTTLLPRLPCCGSEKRRQDIQKRGCTAT